MGSRFGLRGVTKSQARQSVARQQQFNARTTRIASAALGNQGEMRQLVMRLLKSQHSDAATLAARLRELKSRKGKSLTDSVVSKIVAEWTAAFK